MKSLDKSVLTTLQGYFLLAAADGLMEALGPEGFLAVGLGVLALAWALPNFNGKEPPKRSIRKC